MSRTVAVIPLLILVVALIGCGGDDDGAAGPLNGGAPAAHQDNATLTGRVVQANNPSPEDPAAGLVRAVVTEVSTGRSVETGAQGTFELTGLPAGDSTPIYVTMPRSGDYDATTVYIPTKKNQVTTAEIALLPMAAGSPTSIGISPQNAIVEQGADVQFSASIHVNGQVISAQPTWVLLGNNVGSFSAARSGLLNTTSTGVAIIRAMTGELVTETQLTVTSARAPDISSVLVSASKDIPVPATGGLVTVIVAASDGDGVRDVIVEIFPQHQTDPLTPVGATRIAGQDTDGTWRAFVPVPANDNRPDATGVQAPQFYTLRVTAVDDSASRRTATSDWFEFKVEGLDTPPPPGSG